MILLVHALASDVILHQSSIFQLRRNPTRKNCRRKRSSGRFTNLFFNRSCKVLFGTILSPKCSPGPDQSTPLKRLGPTNFLLLIEPEPLGPPNSVAAVQPFSALHLLSQRHGSALEAVVARDGYLTSRHTPFVCWCDASGEEAEAF